MLSITKSSAAPEELYKYLSFRNTRNLQSIFVDSELYFPRPSSFNDPFEFTPRRYKTKKFRRVTTPKHPLREGALDRVLEKHWVEYYEDINRRGVYCLSATHDDIVMWSHYTDGHKGLVAVFRTDNAFFARARPADYDPIRSNLSPCDIVQKRRVDDVMLRKLDLWRYEREWRIVEEAGDVCYPYPAESLIGVIFGCKSHKKDRQLVYKLTEGRELRFWHANLSKYWYRLEFTEIGRSA